MSLPYPNAHHDPIHERDIAEAAFTVLTDDTHASRAYTLTGHTPRDFTYLGHGPPGPLHRLTHDPRNEAVNDSHAAALHGTVPSPVDLESRNTTASDERASSTQFP